MGRSAQVLIMPLIVFANAGDTRPALRSLRFRLVLFLVRMWLLIECPRLIFPLEVNLKRLAAPLWVFCFGKMFSFSVRNALAGLGDRECYHESGAVSSGKASERDWVARASWLAISSREWGPRSRPSLILTAAVPASCSLWPATSMTGTFCI